ncbi:MAG: hypothetical protein WCT77_14865 [Bacteroidota bacterium]
MRKLELVSVVISVLSIFTSMFSEQIRQLVFSLGWREIIFFLGLILLSLTFLSVFIRYLFNQNVKDVLNKYEQKDIKTQKEQELFLESFKKDGVLNRVIIRNVLLVNMNKDTMHSVAEELHPIYYSTGVYVDYFSEYKLPKDLIQEIQKIHITKIQESHNSK